MVATAAQIAANRANARRSTGPRTPEGKAISSRNALSHGAYADDDTILATAADTYLDDLRAHFQPANALEESLVEHLAVLAGRRKRLQLAMDALIELNERHALTEHLREAAAPAHPHRDPPAPAAPTFPALNTATLTSDPIAGPAVAALSPTPVATGQAPLPDQTQSAHPEHRPSTSPEQNEPSAAYAAKEANAPATTDDRGTPSPLQPDRRIEPNAGATPQSVGAALAAKLHEYGIEPTIAAYLAGDEPVFRSVPPRDPNEPSSIPAHWPDALLPGQ
jgi:hypothetical protein